MRFIVIDIGCTECLGTGSCEPEVLKTTDSEAEAIRIATKPRHSTEYSRIVVDTVRFTVIDPNGVET